MKSLDEIIKERFVDVGRVFYVFSFIKYLGIRIKFLLIDFKELKKIVKECLVNSFVRLSRLFVVIYKVLMVIFI